MSRLILPFWSIDMTYILKDVRFVAIAISFDGDTTNVLPCHLKAVSAFNGFDVTNVVVQPMCCLLSFWLIKAIWSVHSKS